MIQGPHTSTKVVYVIDDERFCRTAVAKLVASFGYDVAEFDSAEDFLGFSRSDKSACAILDNRLPGMSGIDLQVQLAARGDKLPLIFLTGFADTTMVVEAMRKGAVTLLDKPVEAAVLRDALEKAFAPTEPIRRIDPSSDSLEKARLIHQLSPREREVANLVASGYSNKRIAAELGLSEKTIEKYRSNCVRKLGVRSSAEMVRAVVTAEMLGI